MSFIQDQTLNSQQGHAWCRRDQLESLNPSQCGLDVHRWLRPCGQLLPGGRTCPAGFVSKELLNTDRLLRVSSALLSHYTRVICDPG